MESIVIALIGLALTLAVTLSLSLIDGTLRAILAELRKVKR